MEVTINEDGKIRCATNDTQVIYCDPFMMWQTASECGNCPVLELCERYEKIKYGDIGC